MQHVQNIDEYLDLYVNNANTNGLGYETSYLELLKCRTTKPIVAPLFAFVMQPAH